jgi:hypothetical protein
LAAWAPLIQLFVDTMIPVVGELTLAFARFQGFLQEMIRTILDLLGIKVDRRDEKRTSRGAAVRNASTTSVEGFAKSLFDTNVKNLFPGAKSKDPAQVNMEILVAMKQGQELFKSIEKTIREILEVIKAAIQTVKDVRGAANNALDAVIPSRAGVASAGLDILKIASPVAGLVSLLGRAKIF